jgi:O-antigen ligase
LQEAYVHIETTLYSSNRIGTHNQYLQWLATYGYFFTWAFGILFAAVLVSMLPLNMLSWMVPPVAISALFESTAQRQAGVLAGLILWIGAASLYTHSKKYQKDLRNSLGI